MMRKWHDLTGQNDIQFDIFLVIVFNGGRIFDRYFRRISAFYQTDNVATIVLGLTVF